MDAKDAEIARLREELDKAQHEVDEVLESTKDIEIQLEQDIALAEQQLQKARRRNDDLVYDLTKYKERFAQAQNDHEKEVSAIQRELKITKKSYLEVRDRLREEESKHDDLERQERIVTTSYQDLENKYHAALEKNAVLESELEGAETSSVECQRLKDEVRDLEAELTVKG
ncbi:Nuclear distribution protein nudE homolog 1 [Taphrina deformans PYCC 5710]|uniref:Nuclear distribution protein nudE homolog 1 n=1 Tax=Taphrina deformans (strain PYCC 5710 / ATCC 11124 / CBS 356.35 / IMI 108563 / JCM 9778 / NBRC 8474) TaxID=1097556 RepID=R4XEG3_TAPDE|nr:Nuclear distribution protein nudE homolog 1 [Taphrina deformans PYCC 5710]|eukprot:CCG82866.1 Nuclear distribution protein nudE homolog 1 [Taphrina deformans PYCC 5710]